MKKLNLGLLGLSLLALDYALVGLDFGSLPYAGTYTAPSPVKKVEQHVASGICIEEVTQEDVARHFMTYEQEYHRTLYDGVMRRTYFYLNLPDNWIAVNMEFIADEQLCADFILYVLVQEDFFSGPDLNAGESKQIDVLYKPNLDFSKAELEQLAAKGKLQYILLPQEEA